MFQKLKKLIKQLQIDLDPISETIDWSKLLKDTPSDKHLDFIAKVQKINALDVNGKSLLVIAAKSYPDLIKPIIQAGGGINKKDKYGYPPLIHAICSSNLTSIETLLLYDADVNLAGQYKITPLMQAIDYYPRCIPLLLQYGAKLNVRDNTGGTPLIHAIYQGNTNLVKQLLEAGAKVNMPKKNSSKNTMTPLMIASLGKGEKDLILHLLKSGANINAKDDLKRTVFDISKQHSPSSFDEAFTEYNLHAQMMHEKEVFKKKSIRKVIKYV